MHFGDDGEKQEYVLNQMRFFEKLVLSLQQPLINMETKFHCDWLFGC